MTSQVFQLHLPHSSRTLTDNSNLYHVIEKEDANKIAANQELYFRQPKSWPDQYEAIYLRQAKKTARKVFAHCWSRDARSIALWERKQPDAIRLKTCVAKMNAALRASLRSLNEYNPKAYILPVRYAPDRKIFNEIETHRSLGVDGYILPLAFKRSIFSFEREVRIVITLSNDYQIDFLKINIDTAKFLEQILISPLFDKAYEKSPDSPSIVGYKSDLAKSFSLDSEKVKISRIYSLPTR